MVDAAANDNSFRLIASTLVNRLAVIGTDIAVSDVQLPLDAAAYSWKGTRARCSQQSHVHAQMFVQRCATPMEESLAYATMALSLENIVMEALKFAKCQ